MTKKNNPREGTLDELAARLFEQMDAVQNPDLEGDKLLEEIERTKCVVEIGKTIIATTDTIVKARVAWDNKIVSSDHENSPKLLALSK